MNCELGHMQVHFTDIANRPTDRVSIFFSEFDERKMSWESSRLAFFINEEREDLARRPPSNPPPPPLPPPILPPFFPSFIPFIPYSWFAFVIEKAKRRRDYTSWNASWCASCHFLMRFLTPPHTSRHLQTPPDTSRHLHLHHHHHRQSSWQLGLLLFLTKVHIIHCLPLPFINTSSIISLHFSEILNCSVLEQQRDGRPEWCWEKLTILSKERERIGKTPWADKVHRGPLVPTDGNVVKLTSRS